MLNTRSERSAGIVPLRRNAHQWRVAMILQNNSWTFPKGHAIAGETTRQTAERELYEETGLEVVEHFSAMPFMETYTFCAPDGIEVTKDVAFYPALVVGKLTPQLAEVRAAKWVRLQDVEELLSFPSIRTIWKEVRALLATLPIR